MQILIVEPKKLPKTLEISENLKEMQAIVGGSIQAIYPFSEEVALICNGEGKMLGFPLNCGLRDERGKLYDIICGTFFLCGVPPDSENFASLTAEQLEQFQERFRTPEMFMNLGGQIICLPSSFQVFKKQLNRYIFNTKLAHNSTNYAGKFINLRIFIHPR